MWTLKEKVHHLMEHLSESLKCNDAHLLLQDHRLRHVLLEHLALRYLFEYPLKDPKH